MWLTRRAGVLFLPALASLADLQAAWANSGRTIAQSVGVDQKNVGVLSDPRALLDGEGLQPLIWGARDRCDPTDPSCEQGGIVGKSLEVQPPPKVANVEITDKVRLYLTIGGEKAGTLDIGLWRKAAPVSVEAFTQLVAGTFGADLQNGEQPASLSPSVALRIERGKAFVFGGLKQRGGSMRLEAGRTRPQYFPIAPPTVTDAPNGVSHTAAGLLSWRRGSQQAVEFSITPRPNPALDETEICFGEVLDGMEVLERLNVLPTNNYNAAPMATVRIERAELI
jgi:cyclophilin family peptidyl-prolyl cis-trans isomerase